MGFRTADKIAQAIGIAPDAIERLQREILHGLDMAAVDGDDAIIGTEAEQVGWRQKNLRTRNWSRTV